MSARRLHGAAALVTAGIVTVTCAHALDLLRAERQISATPAAALVPAASGCPDSTPSRPLQLAEAVARALCANPKTREAWADVRAQSAAVGQARAAYLPTLSATVQDVRESSVINVRGQPTLDTNYAAMVKSGGVSLNWLLFDFGAREAALDSANALLTAAQATQDATLQRVFATVAKDYYAAQAAVSAVQAADDVERMTRESMTAAQAQADHGVAPISDALQAQTQHEEAVYSQAKAKGDAQAALGLLATDMALQPNQPLDVPAVTSHGNLPAKDFAATAKQMIEAVIAAHPAIKAAQAQYAAALAKVRQTRDLGLPSIKLVGSYNRNTQPESAGLGLPTYPASGHEAYIGILINIPLFEGWARNYQIDQAQAEAERQQDVLDDTVQQVALDVWTSYHALSTATQNVGNSEHLLDIAEQAYEAARQRYDKGVGSILELLNTQAGLANARQRRIQALTSWNFARVDLASKLGRLDADDITSLQPPVVYGSKAAPPPARAASSTAPATQPQSPASNATPASAPDAAAQPPAQPASSTASAPQPQSTASDATPASAPDAAAQPPAQPASSAAPAPQPQSPASDATPASAPDAAASTSSADNDRGHNRRAAFGQSD